MKRVDGNVSGSPFKIAFRYAGYLAVMVSILFLVFKLLEYRRHLAGFVFTARHLALLVIGPLLFVLGCFVLSWGWGRLLFFLGENNVRYRECIGIYARANIAKYLPGNVFHYAGRHVLGLKSGFSNVSLGLSLVLEMAGLSLVAALVGILGGTAFGMEQDVVNLWWVLVVIPCAGLAAYPGLKLCLNRFAGRLGNLPEISAATAVVKLMHVLLAYLAFFCLISGIMVATLVLVSGPITLYETGMVCAVFAVSWMAGLLTPGAPSGIGVREAIIIALLGPMIPEADGILISFFFRIITTLGDLLFWIAGLLPYFRIKNMRHNDKPEGS